MFRTKCATIARRMRATYLNTQLSRFLAVKTARSLLLIPRIYVRFRANGSHPRLEPTGLYRRSNRCVAWLETGVSGKRRNASATQRLKHTVARAALSALRLRLARATAEITLMLSSLRYHSSDSAGRLEGPHGLDNHLERASIGLVR